MGTLLLQGPFFFATFLAMDNSTEQFRKEATKQTSTKTLADAIGLPDKEDKERIRLKLLEYEKAHPGEIGAIIALAKQNFQEQGGRKALYGESNKQARGRTLFELPVELGQWLEQAYPLMFRSKAHTAWFARNFRELLIIEKY